MRIGIEVTAAVRQGAGIGRYVRELLRAVALADTANDYRLFYASPSPLPHTLPPLPPNFTSRHLPFHDIWLARLWHRLQLPLNVELITGPIDLYHAPDFTLPPVRARSVLTVHDLSFVRDPESAAPGLRSYLQKVVPRSVRQADHVIAVSEATKADLVEFYQTPESKITVLYEGVDTLFKPTSNPAIRSQYNLGSAPYILSISTIQPRKNYRRLIQAVAALPHEYSLVIAGNQGWLYDEIFAEAEKPGVRGRVKFIGFVPEADLAALYSEAAAFAYPSLYEGFGLPILEAMACGTPVLTSNVSCLPEVAGGAAKLVDPHSVEAIGEGLKQLLAERNIWIERGFTRAARFRWDDVARKLITLYESIGL
ncbi:MAG TPA: glycosyltransferase family 1 protein [Anaerolineales bacterium]|nr:glycosyltransferase family 1 protein [Anaerolineales bacterium]